MPMTTPMSDEELDRAITFEMSYHEGKQNRIDRWDLVEKVFRVQVPPQERNDDNLLDRAIRMSVSRLRSKGWLICDLGDGQGRYMAQSVDEFWEFYSFFVKPIRSKAETARAMKEFAKRRWPNLLQPSLFDLGEIARME